MTDPAQAARPLVVGANHRSSSLMMRDRLFVEASDVPVFLEDLRGAGIEQALVLSTCDRVEVQAVEADTDAAAGKIAAVLAKHADLTAPDLEGQVYVLTGRDAARHLFAVTASLDSLMVGEPQVLGQVKEAFEASRTAGMAGPALESLMQAALASAKRVRSETAIGEGPVSIAAAAAQLARDLHGDLDRCSALLVGDGDMGELVARDLKAGGLSRITAVHPSDGRARALADDLDCHYDSYERLADLLADADVVLTALGDRKHAIEAGMVEDALHARRRKPVFLVDTGIPGDVEPAVERIDGAFLYDLNDLERIAMQSRASRETEARDAWRILDEELAAYLRGRAERTAVPAVTRLRSRFEQAREAVLEDAPDDADKATRLLVNRLLHDPSEILREAAAKDGRADWEALERLLDRLFRLGGEDGEKKP